MESINDNTIILGGQSASKKSLMILRLLVLFEIAVSTTAVLGFVDVAIRILAASVSIAVGIYLIRNYQSQTKLNNIKAEREQQELYEFLKANREAQKSKDARTLPEKNP